MSFNCTRCELCGSAANIYLPGSFVYYSLILRFVFEPICLLGIFLLSIAIYQTKLLHINVRILLLSITVSMVVGNLGVLLETLYSLIVSYVIPEETRCDYQVFNPNACYHLRSIYVAGGTGLAVSTIFLAIERLIATILFKTYEKVKHGWLALILVVLQTACCLFVFFSLTSPRTLPYCAFELIDTERSLNSGKVFLVLNIIALFIFGVLWIINRARTRTLVDSQLRVLSTRYQLEENISTTRLMVPVMLIFILMTISAQIIYKISLPTFAPNSVVTTEMLRTIENYAPYAEFQISLLPFLTIALIFLLPVFSEKIKRTFLRITRMDRFMTSDSNNNVDTVTVDEARDLYFERLHGQWREKTRTNA